MWIKMNAKYPGLCKRCYRPIKVKQGIEYNPKSKVARHEGCKQVKAKNAGRTKNGGRVRFVTGR